MNECFISGTVWDVQRKDGFDAVSLSVYDGKGKDGKTRYFTLKVRVFHDDNGNGVSAQKGQTMLVSGQLRIYEYNGKWYTELKANLRDVFIKGDPRTSQGTGAPDDGIPF